MTRKYNSRIFTPTESYVTYYPQIVELADKQLVDCFWTATEMDVEKDKQDLLVNMTEAEKHAVSTALKLFVKYELFVGGEHWNGRVRKMFPRPEVQRLCAVFGMVEEGIHAVFYDKLNQVLGLNVDSFYESYIEDPVLKARMEFLDEIVNSSDDLVDLAVFSLVEGAVLFSSFALFKNFQSNGNNLISNTVRGINQSAIDEGLHQTAGALLYNIALQELQLSQEEVAEIQQKIKQAAISVLEHEERICEMLCAKGDPRGINAHQLKEFARSRLNICLADLGIDAMFPVGDNPIAKWFYSGVQKIQMIDFFTSGVGREYQRGWNEDGFVWKTKKGAN